MNSKILKILTLSLLPVVVAQRDQVLAVTCRNDIQCAEEGPGACCLRISNSDDPLDPQYEQHCRNQQFVNYYTNGEYYDPVTRIWTNPNAPSVKRYIGCIDEEVQIIESVEKTKFPY